MLAVQDGKLVERQVPMLNALNEVLRDDYIKDSIGGVNRWNKVIEKAGIPFRLVTPHNLQPQDRHTLRRQGQPLMAASSAKPNGPR